MPKPSSAAYAVGCIPTLVALFVAACVIGFGLKIGLGL